MIHVFPRLLELLAHALAMIAAWWIIRPGRHAYTPTVRPVFWFLAATLVSDLVRWAIQACVLAKSARPFHGMPRVFFHLEQAGFVGWSAGIVLLAVLVLGNGMRTARRSAFIVATWGLVLGALMGSYPELRGALLGKAYAAIHGGSVLACLAIAWKAWRGPLWFGVAQRVVSMLIVGDVATLFGPYLGEPFKFWPTAQVLSFGTYALVTWELRRTWRHPR